MERMINSCLDAGRAEKKRDNRDRLAILNFIKGIGCICVVFIHFRFPGVVGDMIWKLGQFAVPIFFMIAGYFAYGKDQNTLYRRLKKITSVLLVAYICYFLYNFIKSMYIGMLEPFIEGIYSLQAIIKLVCFSTIPFAIHLWYLITMAETYLLFIISKKYRFENIIISLMPLFIILHIVIVVLVESMDYPWFLKMNFLVWGPPLYLIGYYFAKIRKSNHSINSKISILLTVLGAIIALVPVLYDTPVDFSEIGVIALAIGIFSYSFRVKNKSISTRIEFLGDKLSTDIYLWHCLVGEVLKDIFANFKIFSIILNRWLFPLIVCFVSISVSLVLFFIRKKFFIDRH